MRRVVLILLCLIMLVSCCGCSSKADKAEIRALKREIESLNYVIERLQEEALMDDELLAKSYESERKLEGNQEEESVETELAYVVEKDEIAKYITLKELYTDKQMRQIIAKEAGDCRHVYFFLPDAPRKKYATFVEDGILPDKDHCLAYYLKYGERWKIED